MPAIESAEQTAATIAFMVSKNLVQHQPIGIEPLAELIRARDAAVREAVLEEAAHVCETECAYSSGRHAAEEIRSLKDKP